MSLTSPTFFAFLAVTVIAFHLTASVAVRRAVLTIASAVFIASYLTDPVQAAPLLLFLVLGYACLRFVQAGRTGAAVSACVVAVILTYIYLKRFSFTETFLTPLPFPYLTLGLSYILFRMIQVVVDAGSGELPGRVGPFAFFRYTCNFLCFVSGPIQRYQDFAATDGLIAAPLDADRVYRAFSRIVTGYMKFVVVAASANYLYAHLGAPLLDAAPIGFAKLCVIYSLTAAAYTAYLYFNFSGYMDIVIGIGVLLGQALPENFDRPFSARSFLEFWQRWHMTLSNWFKLYLFNPFLMFLMARFPAPALTAYLGVIAFFVTFLVMGVWHGTTRVFVIYGLLMGAGASVNKLWQILCTNRLGKKRYKALGQTTAYSYAARGLTFAYFTLALTCLWLPELPQFLQVVGRLGAPGLVGALILLTLGFGVAALALDAAIAGTAARGPGIRAAADGVVFRNMGLATRLLAIFAIASLFNKAPEFVYRAF
ncbi:MAG: MBOAT family O-acyltransferase [Janthinobacterium lividum]